MARARKSGGGFGSFVVGFVIALVLAAGTVFVYFQFGTPPVAVVDPPFPFEKNIVRLPLNARIDRELKQPPFGTSEDVFEAGARVYRNDCASCHGTPGHDVPLAAHMYPVAPQLWKKHSHGNVVGVSDDSPGETYWKVENGIRLTGMPAFRHLLSDAQMWQVSLLLKSADQPLPDPVMQILTNPKL
ncbi:MAG TPA: cytochrome c [Granulicella sp.]|jgi:thiosulfate dehydrogenase|nr:cytochrome c [Granulicella sp.]